MTQQMNENFGHQLMEYAINRVRGYLDYPYEIDDESWDEDGFQFIIVDGSQPERMRVEDRMRFFWHDALTDDENYDRLDDEVNGFIERWSA